MKSFISTLTIFLSLAMVSFTNQASNLDNVIDALKDGKASEIGKYLDENVEITLPDKSNSYSKAQAILILKDFFDFLLHHVQLSFLLQEDTLVHLTKCFGSHLTS